MDKIDFIVEGSIAKVTLNRPEHHNAFNGELISKLSLCFDKVHKSKTIRAMILQSNGKSFSAGADLEWMKDMANYSESENVLDAQQLAQMFNKLYLLNKPTIARVQGPAYGGAIGLIACCDIAIASKLSKFCMSEAKFGLVPATISPYVVNAIGPRIANRLFLTAEVISARRARRIGLISEVVSEQELDTEIESIISNILKNGPIALSHCKELVREVSEHEINNALIDKTSKLIAKLRVSTEGQEGLKAFLEKRKAMWASAHD